MLEYFKCVSPAVLASVLAVSNKRITKKVFCSTVQSLLAQRSSEAWLKTEKIWNCRENERVKLWLLMWQSIGKRFQRAGGTKIRAPRLSNGYQAASCCWTTSRLIKHLVELFFFLFFWLKKKEKKLFFCVGKALVRRNFLINNDAPHRGQRGDFTRRWCTSWWAESWARRAATCPNSLWIF